MTTFGSVCSGIEAASVAWHLLGWKAAWLSEIEPFPCAVLAHHYPDVPNLGDMTTLTGRIASGEVEAPDVFTGGTPCQAFSVAGKRGSLADARGNLSLTFCEIADAIDDVRAAAGREPSVIVWENVPGVLSTTDNAFGCFLGALAGAGCELQPAGGRWTNAGVVLGPRRAVAWRVLDAQYFGLAQRRRRVFVVASARNGFDPAAVLFEFDGLRRDSAPSREAREGTSACATERAASRCGGVALGSGQAGAEVITDGGAPTLTCLHEAPIVAFPTAYDLRNGTGSEVSMTLQAAGMGTDRGLAPNALPHVVTHSLRGEGFDASEDGTGRGTPLVPVAFDTVATLDARAHAGGFPGTDGACGGHVVPVSYAIQAGALRTNPASGPDGVGVQADHAYTLEARAEVQAVAIRTAQTGSNGWGVNTEGAAYTLDTHATQGVAYTTKLHNTASNQSGKFYEEYATSLDRSSPPPAVIAPAAVGAFKGGQGSSAGGIGWDEHVSPTLSSADSGSNRTPTLLTAMQVRRLTPVECERLQGFPTVSEKLTIEVCLDHQNQRVHVALKCLKWQNSAWPADASELTPPVKTAGVLSSISQVSHAPLAALHVHQHSGDELLEIRSAQKLIWSANGAGQSKRSLPSTLTENSVQELAQQQRELAHLVRSGKAGSPLNIRLSFPASSGVTSAEKSGQETKENVSDAMSVQSLVMSTTSGLGLITTFSDSKVETLCCSVLRAIAGCIPETTLTETFSIEMTVETPYTQIPYRNKPASDCPDGPRYRALGNSWAVPVVRWIGLRIQETIA